MSLGLLGRPTDYQVALRFRVCFVFVAVGPSLAFFNIVDQSTTVEGWCCVWKTYVLSVGLSLFCFFCPRALRSPQGSTPWGRQAGARDPRPPRDGRPPRDRRLRKKGPLERRVPLGRRPPTADRRASKPTKKKRRLGGLGVGGLGVGWALSRGARRREGSA